MLLVLLKITSGVLNKTPPQHRENTLGGKLAHPLLQVRYTCNILTINVQ